MYQPTLHYAFLCYLSWDSLHSVQASLCHLSQPCFVAGQESSPFLMQPLLIFFASPGLELKQFYYIWIVLSSFTHNYQNITAVALSEHSLFERVPNVPLSMQCSESMITDTTKYTVRCLLHRFFPKVSDTLSPTKRCFWYFSFPSA